MSKRFSDQFRQSAVEMVSPEHPIAEAAHSLGIGHSTSDKWVRAHRRQTVQLAALNQEQKRIRELKTVYFANPANQ